MHPIYFLDPIAIVYMAFAGFTGRALRHIAIGALLMGALNFSRAALSHVGPIMLLAIGSLDALREGFARLRGRLGGSGAARYAVITTVARPSQRA